jgi:hypothetical protein
MGSWYCDIALGGSSVVLIRDSHLEFNGRHVHLPQGQNVLYVRIAPDGSKFAGVGHRDDLCWQWGGQGWSTHGIAFGPQSVIYDKSSALHVISGPPAVGYRYDAGHMLVTCDDTRRDLARQVWDYTDLGDLTIGQGGDALGHGDDPIIALFEGNRKLLQSGRCRFINAYRDGDQVALACVREDTGSSLLRRLTLDDIRNAPTITGPVKPQPIPLDQIEALSGELLVAWYEQRTPPAVLPPGNAEIAIGHGDGYPPGTVRPRPVLAMLSNYDNITPAFAVQLGSEGMHNEDGLVRLEQMAADLHARGIRPFVYWDDRRPPRPLKLPPGSVFAFMAYCGKNEPLAAFKVDVDAAIREHAQHHDYLLMACQTHNTNDALIEEPSRAIPSYIDLVKWHRRSASGGKLIGVSIFNNSGRDYPDGSKGGLTANPQLVPHWTKAFGACTFPTWLLQGDPVSDEPQIELIDYDKKVSRSDPKGCLIRFDVSSAERIEKVTLQMEGDGEPPVTMEFSSGPDGRYVRALAFKPVRTGFWYPLVKAWDESGRMGSVRGATKIEVTSGPFEPPPPTGEFDLEALLDPANVRFVRSVAEDYPHLSAADATDQVAHRMNRHYGFSGALIRMGRKARNNDANNPNLNHDALTIRLDLNDNSQKKLIDIWIDADSGGLRPTWDVRPAHEEPGNGYWWPPATPALP